ncbi:MAG: Slx4p interacting protein [Alectoria fallacina]|uniref:Slx4p interacting protein n=1 Tax=Alectoria fallacina TaxID=1903189 RepID=A0A8H3F1B2_9LECA|nr:MAG: Slx4p interacting protein [Alectoria fallacina]
MIFILKDCNQCSLFNGLRRWAWHNTHITRRIADEQRITIRRIEVRISPKTGRTRKRPARPRTSLKDKLLNLHLLIRVPSFSRWPLQVRFFCDDVYQAWQRWIERVDGSIRGGIKVLLDLKQPEEVVHDDDLPLNIQANREALGKGGIQGLDFGYSKLKDHVEKSIFFLAEDEAQKCVLCAKSLGPQTAMALLCPQEGCRTASHMICLATKFIEEEGTGVGVTPISGRCPGCKEELQWIDLIKELSLRARGEKEVAQMMKKPKERKTKNSNARNATASQLEARTTLEENAADPDRHLMEAVDASNKILPNVWQRQDDDDDMSITTLLSQMVLKPRVPPDASQPCQSYHM